VTCAASSNTQICLRAIKDQKVAETLARTDALAERLRADDLQALPSLIEAMTGAKAVEQRVVDDERSRRP
jgi:hypothetical protein